MYIRDIKDLIFHKYQTVSVLDDLDFLLLDACDKYDLELLKNSISYLNILERYGNREYNKNFVYHENKWNPLHACCYDNNLELVKNLLFQDKNYINIVDYIGNTPIHIACYWNNLEIVKFLLSYDVSLGIKENYQSNTLLHLASYTEKPEMMKLLLSYPMIFDEIIKIRYGENDTILHHISNNNYFELLKIICSHNFIIREIGNTTNMYLQTALHISCFKGHFQIVKLLLSYEQITRILDVKDYTGYTPLSYAIHHNHLDIVKLLLCYDFNGTLLQKHLYNKTLCNKIIKDYILNRKIIYEWIYELSIYTEVKLFLLIVYISDGYFRVGKKHISFFNIICRLPIELQMLICNLKYGIIKNHISSKYINNIWKYWFIKNF